MTDTQCTEKRQSKTKQKVNKKTKERDEGLDHTPDPAIVSFCKIVEYLKMIMSIQIKNTRPDGCEVLSNFTVFHC